MKKLGIDFDNKCICVWLPNQQGTVISPDIRRGRFEAFIPENMKDKSSFTWDFEAETVTVNKPYKAIDNFMTKECFVPESPEFTEHVSGLGICFDDFVDLLEMKRVNLTEEIVKSNPQLAKYFVNGEQYIDRKEDEQEWAEEDFWKTIEKMIKQSEEVPENKKTLCVSISKSLYEQFDAITEKTGKSKDATIVELISNYVIDQSDILE